MGTCVPRRSGLPMPRRRTFADARLALCGAEKWPQVFNLRCPALWCARRSGLPMPRRRTFTSAFRASAHSDVACASPGTDPPPADWSWLRLSTYAGSRGMGSPEQHQPRQVISAGEAAGSEARAEAGDTCGRRAPTFRQSRELTSAAGAEHASGRLRRRALQAGFHSAERDRGSGIHRRLKTCGHFPCLRPAAPGLRHAHRRSHFQR